MLETKPAEMMDGMTEFLEALDSSLAPCRQLSRDCRLRLHVAKWGSSQWGLLALIANYAL